MLYELTMFGRFQTQNWICRWNYLSSGVPAAVSGSFGLMSAFGAIPAGAVYPSTKLFFNLMRIASTDCAVDSITVRAPAEYAVEDFYERPFLTPYTGGSGALGSSPVLAFGWRTNRVRLDIARGTKRLPGVPETAMGTGGNIEAAVLTVMNEIAVLMSSNLTYDDEGNTVTYAPVVVQKEEYTTPRGKRAYKYYPTLEEQLDHVAQGIQWQPYTQVRTQVSRQYGRGG